MYCWLGAWVFQPLSIFLSGTTWMPAHSTSHHTRTRVRVHTHTKKRLGDVAASCVRGQTRSVHVV